jgi:hypothetical protein
MEKMRRLSFYEFQGCHGGEGRVTDRVAATRPSIPLFRADMLIHHPLPSSSSGRWINRAQIGLSRLTVQSGLAMRFVFRVEQSARFLLVFRAKAGLLSRKRILAVKNRTATEQCEPVFHRTFLVHEFSLSRRAFRYGVAANLFQRFTRACH